MTDLPLTPRPAATLVPLRDGPQGLEVFMLQRTHKAAFIPGGYVFPGGALEPGDKDPLFTQGATSPDPHEASRLLGLEEHGLSFWEAAVRECFEEAGLLLAYGNDGQMAGATASLNLAELRRRLADGELGFAEACQAHGLRPAFDQLAYFAHWVTPTGAPRRFTTRFFVCEVPAGQAASHDGTETIGNLWIRPGDALMREEQGDMPMMFATRRTLELLASFTDTQAALAHARALRSVARHEPRVAAGPQGRRVLLAGDAAYAEVGKLDPLGRGNASSEIVPGKPTVLSPTVRRIAAPNPSYMTGPGTNAYFIGAGEDIAVIDPGPALAEHVEALLRHAEGRIRWILFTHTHLDHSPAAMLLKEKTGAQVIGRPAPPGDRQDQGCQPDIVPEDGQRLELGGVTLQAVHTPGHASNHLCYLHETEKILFTGDHVMQGSTVVINPPDGDLRAYLDSLVRLKSLDVEYFAPGHGFLMDKPHAVIDRIVAHRLGREAKVADVLQRLGSGSLEELLPLVYDDVSEKRWPMARRSLLAHLLKLRDERRASETAGTWQSA
ncbi:MBL fold metallo-hydrolase [Noviherbaspirillum galbum]|uniref:MBL fold metallo-hydrolase n=1 Tax=Noviherbaspirillum galbum TaxID=2709383 RepID=A0A6B3SF29_9BURK|nr:MBL fold metallo-hydrolase [Noviherbaspirillum galbum]NEX59507.1 MBL fold metallo-hydrolase [Noviherbaspirillum galbum]